MPLTTVVGSSGSGKTTFLNDVHRRHKCTYLRQYHNMRPYIPVNKIPNFDPTQLPFWHLYEQQGTASKIQVGGTMAGKFLAGLSGGQRKLLLFEIMYQRTMSPIREQNSLLLVLDEPFAGVTDDFVPFILERLNLMRQKHNILLVTNDHIGALTDLADNILTVSAIDRTKVRLQTRGDYEKGGGEAYERERAIMALSWGEDFQYPAFSKEDLKFFWETEVLGSGAGVSTTLIFVVISFALFLMTFWGSADTSAALVLIGASSISFFVISPYLLSFVDWRNYITEEADALVHASKGMNKFLKTMLTLSLMIFISILQYGVLQLTIDNLKGWDFWVAMLFDSASLQFPFICFGIYTTLSHMTVEILAGCPFLFMIFFSTTYSPSAGLPIIKELRYLFARFYLWCMVPYVDGLMEGCPTNPNMNLFLLMLTGCMCVILFVLYLGILRCFRARRKKNLTKSMAILKLDTDFNKLQFDLSGNNFSVDDEEDDKERSSAKSGDTTKTEPLSGGGSSSRFSFTLLMSTLGEERYEGPNVITNEVDV